MTLTLQSLIDSGAAWHTAGSIGREAMDALRSGQCVLPEVRHTGAYGQIIPSRHDVGPGTTGSLELHETWLENHEPEEDEPEEEPYPDAEERALLAAEHRDRHHI